ncbi:phospholipid:diacylglycerol acyltransferase [Rhodofomes roseus]|uniref:Phospholipid:diacylglycerol acyltransferase n=1 Tax=Rhodofomes roseus TaxID=34475 RepID=A0ABQ8JXK1_9APHY|nr:phospholipid:diacylglycerol acyltransferase [Rhodofomes roseus]KAH9828727.1 phospholipid:diacylglycerol acyltransferase [Rhodofomes roseus]
MALRKRANAHADDESATTSDREHELNEVRHLKQELAHKVDDLKRKQKGRHWFATRRFIFPLGVILGVLLGFSLIQPSDFTDLQTHLALLFDSYDFSLPQMPQIELQIDLTRFETEWRRLWSNVPEPWKLNTNGLEFTVGEKVAEEGLTAKHPIVLIPGIISTGLESWSTTPEYRPFFRQKLWGGFSMLQQVVFNKEKWMAALMLDPVTGLDPPGAKVRAAEGIDAASSFVQGYWLWSKIVENLAVVNYDTNNLHLAPYDWRLSYWNLEERDSYFTKLKMTIEAFRIGEGRRVVLAAHSMGSTVMLYFFKWVESPEHGNGGPTWVEDNIEALVTIAGTHLGVVKAMSAFLSGEMKDTVQVHPAGAYVLERFFSRKERQTLFRSWAGSASMWMKGGEAVWGNATFAPDDRSDAAWSHGELILFRESVLKTEGAGSRLRNMTASEASTWILERTPTQFQKMIESNYSFGIERDEEQLKRNNFDHRKWTNPLEIQLPNAPTTKIYCVYGHGKDTERSYWYTREGFEHDEVQADVIDAQCANVSDCMTPRTPLDLPLLRKSQIDAEYTDEGTSPPVVNGVRRGEGDGTVNLLSLGAMCVEGWKRKRWNPAGMKVVTVELPHEPSPTIPRGGGTTGDHVDILGSTALNEIILRVATGAGDQIHDAFVSKIRDYAKRIQWD